MSANEYDYVNPFIFKDKAKQLQDDFSIALNRLADTYPNGRLNGDLMQTEINKTYSQSYQEAKNRILDLQEDYFLYKDELIRNNQTIIKNMNTIDEQINKLDDENKNLKTQLASLKGSSYSAEGMLDDSKITRNQILVGNIFLCIIVAGGGFMYYKNFVAAA